MSKLELTVVILAHRDDERLKKCLQSVAYADEVIVFDNNSGVKWKNYSDLNVIPVSKPIQNFAALRNQGLKRAHHDWIFFLDSDEYLETNAEEKIRKCIVTTHLAGFFCQRIDIFANQELRHGEVGSLFFLRLMRKNLVQFERPVHEVAIATGPTENSDLIIYHQAHQDLTEFLAKINTYAQLEAASRPKYSSLRWWMELCFWPLGKFLLNFGLKLGFLDGWRGLVYAYTMSLHSLLVRIYVYEYQQAK